MSDTGTPLAHGTAPWRRALRRILPALVFSLVYFGVLVYPVLRILGLCFPAWQPQVPELLAILVGPAAGRMLCEWLPGPLTRGLSALVMTWLGLCFVAFCLVVPWELVYGLLRMTGVVAGSGSGTGAGFELWSGWLLLSTLTVLGAAGVINARLLHVREIPIRIPGSAAEAARGLTLVQISDVHLGSRSRRFLAQVVRRVNALPADRVLITGDLVDFRGMGADQLAALGELRACSYFVIGNHERYVDCDAICERLQALGIRVLRNETALDGPLQLIGIDDAEPKTQVGKWLARLEAAPDRLRILLYHRPDGVRDAAAWGVHLMLAGHTHNGQIVPFNYLVKRVFPRISGLHRLDDLQLYVSPGTGTWGPVLRLGSRSEITVLKLV